MNLHKQIFPIIISFFSFNFCFSQYPLPGLGGVTFPSISEPSADAYSISQYGYSQPNLYTGTPNINIPVYEMNFEGVSFPINLSYRMNGLKPNENASWVGLGWTLSATSVITRSIQDKDDLLNDPYGVGSDLDVGWIFNEPFEEIESHPAGGYWSSDIIFSQSTQSKINENKVDLEPDIFSVGLFNTNLKFILKRKDISSNVVEGILLNSKTHKVLLYVDEQKFEITDDKGFKYEYDEREITQVHLNGFSTATNPANPFNNQSDYRNQEVTDESISSWLLTKIIAPSGRFITFNYDKNFKGIYARSLSGRDDLIVTGLNGNIGRDCDDVFNAWRNAGGLRNYFEESYSSVEQSILTSIKNGKELLTFHSSERADLEPYDGTSKGYKLDALSISFGTDPEKKDFTFSTSYFNEQNSYPDIEKSIYLRLKLDKINLNGEIFSFNYNSPNLLPRKNTAKFDYWGYYNGYLPNSLWPPHEWETSYPLGSGQPETVSYSGSYRLSNETYSKIGVLNRVNYPTGGYTNYVYESHTVAMLDQYKYVWENDPSLLPEGQYRNANVGGLRIKTQQNFDLEDEIVTQTSYRYVSEDPAVSSGQLMDEGLTFDQEFWRFHNPAGNCKMNYMALKSNPITPNRNTAQGSHLGYSQVMEKVENVQNNDSYKKIYGFSNSKNQKTVHLTLNQYALDAYSVLCPGCPGIAGGPIKVSSPSINEGIIPQSADATPPQTFDFRNGNLLNEKWFDSQDNLVKEVSYSYKTAGRDDRYYAGIKNLGGYFDGYKMVRYINYPVMIRKSLLESIEEIRYVHDKNIKNLTTNHYDDYWQLKENTYQNSKNENIKSVLYYPYNYSIFNELINLNILSAPVKREKIKEDILISGTINDYNSIGMIEESFNYESVSLMQPASHDPNTLIEEGYESVGKISYKGNRVSEIQNRDGIVSSYIWGYGYKYPIAIAKNAKEDEIAYSSFESGFDSWEVSYGTVPDDGVTGKKCVEPLSGSIKSKHQFPPGTYRISMYAKNINGAGGAVSIQNYGGIAPFWPGNNDWKYDERIITLTSTEYLTFEPSASSGIYIDDLKVVPVDAEMTTYTYNPLIGITHVVDPNGKINEYRYDEKGRLIEIRDQEGMLLKTYEYHLATD